MNFSFNDLRVNKLLQERLTAININNPTKIQEKVIKEFKNDIIVQSPTGTGKTLSFLIPIIDYMLNMQVTDIFALILVPTRELAQQIGTVLSSLQIKSTVIIEGVDEVKEYNNIFIATPGRFNSFLLNSNIIFISSKRIPLRNFLKRLRFLILDEADKLLDLGFKNQFFYIFNHVNA